MRRSTIQPAYGLADLLVEVGSCLGLWLGFSVIGLYDLTALGVPRLRVKIKQALNTQPDVQENYENRFPC